MDISLAQQVDISLLPYADAKVLDSGGTSPIGVMETRKAFILVSSDRNRHRVRWQRQLLVCCAGL